MPKPDEMSSKVTGRYAPVAALGEEGNVLQCALADEWSYGDELAQQLPPAAGEAEPGALASGASATGGSQEADPQGAPADPLKKRLFWEHRAPRRTLALGLVVLVGLGGYAWHRVNSRPLPPTEVRFRLTAAPGASSSAPSAAGSVTPEWDTASPMAISDPQLVPRLKEEDSVTVEEPFPTPVQTNPATPIGSAAPAPSAALAEADLALPPPPAPSTTLEARVRWRRIDRPPAASAAFRFGSGCLGIRKPRKLNPANPGN